MLTARTRLYDTQRYIVITQRRSSAKQLNVLPGGGALQSKSFIEFFAGIGLIHEALSPLGWHCSLANDNDPRKVAAYKANYPDVPFSDADIRDIPASSLPHALLATASFPCIDLSQAGGRRGIEAEHSGIVWSFLEHVSDLITQGKAPQFLLLENVVGLLTLHEGRSIDLLLTEIAKLGYSFDLIQVDAQHFTPQTRNRVFVVAVRDASLAVGVEMPDTHIRRYKVRQVFERNRDLPWAFFDFPSLPEREISLQDVIEEIPSGDRRWWDAERMDYFWSHLEHDHKPRLMDLMNSGADVYLTATRRGRRRGLREQIINIRWDGLAACLRTPKGGSSIQFIVRLRNGTAQVRKITGIESARLQGVALPNMSPNFVIPDGEQSALYAFGDAVCVPAVRWVVKNSIEKFLAEGAAALLRPASSSAQLELDFGAIA